MQKLIARWTQSARRLKLKTYTLYFAYRDPRLPWYARLVVASVVLYAFSPLDLIPDFIPVLGFVDDLIIVPLGVALAVKLIPPEVMAEAQAKAEVHIQEGKPMLRSGIILIVLVWLILAALGIALIARIVQR